MAQRVYWNWKDPDLTADLNKWLRGFLPSGVYRGFDRNVNSSSGWHFKMSPTTTAVTIVDNALDEVPTSVLITRQGSIVTETGDTVLVVSPSVTGFNRIDLIICTHTYDEIVGGTTAVYSVVEGTPRGSGGSGPPDVPAIPNPLTDVLLYTLYVYEGTTNISEVTFLKASVPEFANKPASIPLTQRNAANGVATLGSDSYVNSLVPALATDAWLRDKITTNEKTAVESIVGFPLEKYFSGVPIIVVLQGGEVSTTGPNVSITAGVIHYNGKNYPLEATTITGSDTTAYLEFVAGTNSVLDKTFSYSNGYFTLKDDSVPSFTVTTSHRLTTLKYLNCAVTNAVEVITPTRVAINDQDYKLVKRGTLINLYGHISVEAITGANTSAPFIVLDLFARYAHATGVDIRFPVSIINITENTIWGGYGLMQTGSRYITIYFGGPVPVEGGYYIDFNYTYEARYLH